MPTVPLVEELITENWEIPNKIRKNERHSLAYINSGGVGEYVKICDRQSHQAFLHM